MAQCCLYHQGRAGRARDAEGLLALIALCGMMQSFFNQLYEDTTEFLGKYIDQLGGEESVCLIEVRLLCLALLCLALKPRLRRLRQQLMLGVVIVFSLSCQVGCGTGEALVPLYDRAKYCIGVEINEVRCKPTGGLA